MHTITLKKEIRSILKRDMVLTISLVLALVSSLFFKPRNQPLVILHSPAQGCPPLRSPP